MSARDTTWRDFARQPHVIAIILFIVFIVIGSIITATRRVRQTAELSNMTTLDACKQLIKDENLCNYASTNETSNNKSRVMTITTTKKDNPEISTTIIELESADRYKSISHEGQKEVDATIIIGNKTYIKDYQDSVWAYYEAPDTAENDFGVKYDFKSETSQDTKEFKENYRYEGQEPCGPLTCYKYKISNDNQVTYLWFDNQQFLTQKILSTSDNITENTIFEYKNVSISEPTPTKKVTEDDIKDYLKQELKN